MTDKLTEEQKRDWQFAVALSRGTRANPESPYTGKCVAVVDEKVVATANNLSEMHEALTALGIGKGQGMVIEASIDYEPTYYISPWFQDLRTISTEDRLEGDSRET